MRTQLIVGVCGGSGAGKHRVIHHHLLPALQGDALILEHDWYYHELDYLLEHQGVASREEVNYDHPDAYETDLLLRHLETLKAGEPIEVRPYQKGSGYRRSEPFRLEPSEVVIVDGMLTFAAPSLVSMLTIRAYVHADDALRLSRRIERDRSFSTVEESTVRFQRDVLPAHRQFVEPSRAHAHFVLLNSRDGSAPEGVDAFIAEVLRTRDALRRARDAA